MKLRNKIIALLGVFALALAMLMAPSTAFAAITADSTGTITITGVAAGDTVSAWRIVDASYDASTNNITYAMNAHFTDVYTTLDAYTAANTGTAANLLAADAIADSTAADKMAVATGDGAVLSDLPMGSYLIVVTAGNNSEAIVYQNVITNLVPTVEEGEYVLEDVEAEIKSTPVDVDKKVGTGTEGNYNDGPATAYGVGDHVPFQVKTAIPAYPENATSRYFALGDTMTAGLTFDQGSVTVVVGEDTLVAGTDYTITESATGFEIVFKDATVVAHINQSVTLTYTATINDAAAADAAAGLDTNTITLTYSNKPFDGTDYDTKTDEVKVSTLGLYLKKLGKGGEPLPGAVFTVTDASGTTVGTITTGTDGFGSLDKLKPGVYTLTETTVPAGYQAVESFTVEITADNSTDDDPTTSSVTEVFFHYAGEYTDAETPVLPVTGGAGTLALTVGGVALIAAGIVLVMRVARKSEN